MELNINLTYVFMMKKILSSFCLFAIVAMCVAQDIKTYSVYDSNQSGDINIEDVTGVVSKVKANVAAASTQQYVTAEQLSALFKEIKSDLDLIKAKLEIGGGDTPSTPQSSASFEVAKKSLHVGDKFTQTVTSTSEGSVSYISSNTSVATVDATSGLVTAVANGETVITAVITATSSSNALSASYTIVVEDANVLNGHEYVDLGLSVKWAKTNIGAENIYDYGDYFAWGETSGYNSGKKNFSTSTYTYYKSSTAKDADGFDVTTYGYSKYVKSSNASEYGYEGFYDDKTTLESTDDAATANWGEGWKMPTQEQWAELNTKCTWEWKTLNGKNGYKVTASNGNYIFLPAAGSRYSTNLNDDGSYGNYWSSTLHPLQLHAYGMYFSSGGHTASFSSSRYCGQSVRPVCSE